MNLLIHDLDEKEWGQISQDYQGWEVIAPSKEIKPCAGCFGCWLKTPGECVIKDGYNRMGYLIHKADELVVMTGYTYGGFSSFVKNVFDRSIGWVLPYFRIVDNEMHHKMRYPESKKITVIFRGHDLTKEDQADAKRYVEAVCRNFNGVIKDIRFEELEDNQETVVTQELQEVKETPSDPEPTSDRAPGKTILLNGSLRGDNSISARSMADFSDQLDQILGYAQKFLILVSVISLVVGGIGVMNIMLVSVTERTREIGIRKAVGAKMASIMTQFIAEAAILTFTGGMIGIIFGLTVAYILCQIVDFEFIVNPVLVLIVVAISTAIGLFFGIYPARKAANLDPIEALRME